MAFDVKKAKAAGYTDAEIADYLSQQSGFNVQGAREAGYQDNEITTHLVGLQQEDERPINQVKKAANSAIDFIRNGLSGVNFDPVAVAQQREIEKNRSVMSSADGQQAPKPAAAPLVKQPSAQAAMNEVVSQTAPPALDADIAAERDRMAVEDFKQRGWVGDDGKTTATGMVAKTLAERGTGMGQAVSFTGLPGTDEAAMERNEQIAQQLNERKPSDDTLGTAAYSIANGELDRGLDYIKQNAAAGAVDATISTLGIFLKPLRAPIIMAQGASEGGNTFRDSVEAGMSEEAALGRGAFQALTASLTEMVGFAGADYLLGKLTKMAPTAQASLIEKAMASAGKAAGTAGAISFDEGGEEVINSIANDLADKYGFSRLDMSEDARARMQNPDILGNASESFVAGALGGAVASPVAAGASVLQDVQTLRAEQAVNYTLNTDQHQKLDDDELQQLRTVADLVNQEKPGAVDLAKVDAEIERRASLPTLTKAAEAAQRGIERTPLASEALEAADILGDENADQLEGNADLVAGPVAEGGNLGEGGMADLANQPNAWDDRGRADNAPEIPAQGSGSDQPLGDAAAGDAAVAPMLDADAHAAATSPTNDLPEPTDAQKEAGNYKKGAINVGGLNISVENPEGSVRRSKADAVDKWETTMTAHYGYVKGVKARAPDKEHVDVYVKPGTADSFAGDVYVVNQVDPKTGKFDEPKVMIGYESQEEAEAGYRSNYTPDWKGMGSIAAVPMQRFKEMLQDEKAFLQPVGSKTAEPADENAQEALNTLAVDLPDLEHVTTAIDAGVHPANGKPYTAEGVRREVISEAESLIGSLESVKEAIGDNHEFAQEIDRVVAGARKAVANSQPVAPTGSELKTEIESPGADYAPLENDSSIAPAELAEQSPHGRPELRPLIEALIKRRAAANQIGKLRQFQSMLDKAKAAMNGDDIKPAAFKNGAIHFNKVDEETRGLLMQIHDALKIAPNSAANVAPAIQATASPEPEVFNQTDDEAANNAHDLLPQSPNKGLEPEKPVESQEEASEPELSEESAANASEPKQEIQDFGEKLGGARKDMAKAMSKDWTDDEIASQPLSKIWPAVELEEIEDKFVAAVAFAARYEIPSKPRVAYKVKRWVEQVKTLRTLASLILGGHITKEHFAEELKRFRLEKFDAKVRLLEAIDRQHWKRIGNVSEYPQAYYFKDGEKVPAPQVHVQIDDKNHSYSGSSIESVMEHVTEALGEAPQAKRMEFEIRGRGGSYFINKKGDPLYRKLKSFADSKAAIEYRTNHYDELVAAWESVKQSDNVKETDLRSKENKPRTGADHRKGRNVTPEQFSKTFGFRGVEFGNWVSQGANAKERQGMLNQAYDALMDLSAILNIPPQAISLNGSLGLGFGSRGHGWASAHFESSALVINLTKTRGAGNLAHEWFHALDNYFQRERIEKGGALSRRLENNHSADFITYQPENYYVGPGGFRVPESAFDQMLKGERDPRFGIIATRYRDPALWKKIGGVRPEVGVAFDDLVKALNASPMKERAQLIDAGRSGYWSSIIEMGARSFENYIIHKMKLNGYDNDYLANVTKIEDFGRDPGRYPYLLDSELAPVEEAFDNVFATLKTKETEKGVALFSRSPERVLFRPQMHEGFAKKLAQHVAMFKSGDQKKIRAAGNDPILISRTPVVLRQVMEDDGSKPFKRSDALVGQGSTLYLKADNVHSRSLHTGKISMDVLNRLPELLADPVAIFKSSAASEDAKSFKVLIDATDENGNPVIVAVRPAMAMQQLNDERVNFQATIFPTTWDQVRAWNKDGLLRYYNEKSPRTSKPASDPLGAGASDAHTGEDFDATIGVQASKVKVMTKGEVEGLPPAAWSRGAGRGMNREMVQMAIDDLKAKWKNAPDVVVVDDMNDARIRVAVRDENDRQLSQGASGQPEGFFDAGKVFIVASEMNSSRDVQRVLFHEALGHYGLRGVFGPALDDILDQIYMTRRSDVLAKAQAYGLEVSKKGDRRIAAEEVLAEMAQNNPRLGFVQRAIAAIRSWLRKAGFDIDMTDAEIVREFIEPARAFVQRGKQAEEVGNLVAAFQRVYHGSPHRFDQFSLDAVGTGEGAQAYGYGLYFASQKAVAEHYQNQLSYYGSGFEDAELPEDVKAVLRKVIPPLESPLRLAPDSEAKKIIKESISGQRDAVYASMQEHRSEHNEDAPKAIREKYRVLTAALEAVETLPKGHLYEVEIPNDDTMLLWDEPLSEQPQAVYSALAKEYEANAPGLTLAFATDGDGRALYRDLEDALGGKEAASKYLHNLGINGIKYLDGVSRDAGDGSYNYVVFDDAAASVVKPAFSRGQDYWDPPANARLDNLIYTLQDKNIDLKRVTARIQDLAGQLEDRWDAYLQEELYHGRAAKRTKDFINEELEPLIDDMRKRGVSMVDLEQYLWARHAEERNVQIAKINPDLPDGGSGMTTQEARDYLSGLKPSDRKNYEALADRVDAITRKSRQVLVDYGLESEDTIKAWGEAYDNYVPLMREDMDHGFAGGTGQGFSVKGSSSKRATGSTRKVVDILANIAQQRERNIIRGEKNRVATALIGLAKLNPNPDFWKTDTVPKVRTVSPAKANYEVHYHGSKVNEFSSEIAAKKFIDYEGKPGYEVKKVEIPEQVEDRPDPNYKNRPNVIVARIVDKKGQVVEHSVVFEERDERAMRMAASLKNLDQDQIGEMLGAASVITRYFASINTQYNPIFGIVNILRDSQGALFNLTSTELAGKQKEVMAATPAAMFGIYKDVRGRRKKAAKADSEWAQLWEEFQKEGGQTGYRDMFKNARERAENLEHALDPKWWQKRTWGKVVSANGLLAAPEQWLVSKPGKAVFDWLSDYNETLENAVRLAAYKVGLDNGMSKQRAASLAKNLTVNFNRKGEMGRQIGALYAFFNASVQGTARIMQTLTGPAGKQIVAGGLLLGVIQAVVMALAGFDDDEPPEFERDRNLIIPIGDGKYLKFAMPLGFNAIPAFGRIATEWALDGFTEGPQRLVHVVDMLLDVTNPIGNAGFSMQTLAPTALDPIAALTENKDWTGRPIAREDMSSLNPTPGHTRAKDTASAFGKSISHAINYLTGGTDFKPGAVSPTPDQVDYLIGQLAGGVGREYLKAEQTATSAVTGEDLPVHKIPLFGRFYGDTTGQSSQAAEFYSNLRELNEHENEIKGRRKAGQDVLEYRRENPEASLIQYGNLAERQLQALRKRKRELVVKEAPKEKIAKVDERITAIMTRLNERVRAKKKSSE